MIAITQETERRARHCHRHWLLAATLLLTSPKMIVALPFTHRAHWDKAFKQGIKAYEECDFAEAEPLYQSALHIYRETLGCDHCEIALLLHDYATLLQKTNHDADAERMQAEAFAIVENRIQRQAKN
jgi:hypothetical protein